jgi:Protein of unknown function (DUF4245)
MLAARPASGSEPRSACCEDGRVSEQTRRPRLGRVGDMVRSLLLLLAVVAVVVVLAARPNGSPVRVVVWEQDYQLARSSADYPLLAPRSLPEGWRATSVRATPTAGEGSLAWHLGFVTPAGEYAALEQSDGDTARFVADMTRDGAPDGVEAVDGEPWQRTYRRSGEQDYRSLVRDVDAAGSVVVVAGTASYAELAELAGALR